MPEKCDVLKKVAACFAYEAGRGTRSSVSRRWKTCYDILPDYPCVSPLLQRLAALAEKPAI